MTKRKTTEQFVKESIDIHGNEFSYENTIYINSKTKVKILCKVHGEFEMLPQVHTIQKSKCPSCYGNKKKNTEQFVKESIEIHDNSFSYENTIYKNNSTKVDIFCNKCKNQFSQLPSMHLQGQGCPFCYGNKKISKDEFYKYVKILYKNFYTYTDDYSGFRKNITVICPVHGEFTQLAQSHYNGHKCQKCAKAGFDKNKESYFYIQEIYDNEKLIGYKFGITNNTPKQRMKKQSYHTNYTQKILFSIIGDGMFIYNLEKYIKMQFKDYKLSKSEFGDGYTETISSDLIELLEDEIINFILTN